MGNPDETNVSSRDMDIEPPISTPNNAPSGDALTPISRNIRPSPSPALPSLALPSLASPSPASSSLASSSLASLSFQTQQSPSEDSESEDESEPLSLEEYHARRIVENNKLLVSLGLDKDVLGIGPQTPTLPLHQPRKPRAQKRKLSPTAGTDEQRRSP
jgi:hypothetical protein